jgi:hypothetical protein
MNRLSQSKPASFPILQFLAFYTYIVGYPQSIKMKDVFKMNVNGLAIGIRQWAFYKVSVIFISMFGEMGLLSPDSHLILMSFTIPKKKWNLLVHL